MARIMFVFLFFFFNDTATTEIYTLSLHDALPICPGPDFGRRAVLGGPNPAADRRFPESESEYRDRKSTRLNSSHDQISYAVFCLKKKNISVIFSLSGHCHKRVTHRLHTLHHRLHD